MRPATAGQEGYRRCLSTHDVAVPSVRNAELYVVGGFQSGEQKVKFAWWKDEAASCHIGEDFRGQSPDDLVHLTCLHLVRALAIG